MKYETMSAEQLLLYVRKMDANYKKLIEARSRILQEIKDMQERKEILSWDEIASAVAYPKAISDTERVNGGEPDSFKLLHQAERITGFLSHRWKKCLKNWKVQRHRSRNINSSKDVSVNWIRMIRM